MNIQELKNILVEAQQAAAARSMEMYNQHGDGWACGFAWVNIYEHNGTKIKGNTKLGKLLKAAGVRQDYTRAFQVWGGEWYNGQSIDIKEAGAQAYAEVLRKYGFTAYAGSRLD
jgi:hypothetical protein